MKITPSLTYILQAKQPINPTIIESSQSQQKVSEPRKVWIASTMSPVGASSPSSNTLLPRKQSQGVIYQFPNPTTTFAIHQNSIHPSTTLTSTKSEKQLLMDTLSSAQSQIQLKGPQLSKLMQSNHHSENNSLQHLQISNESRSHNTHCKPSSHTKSHLILGRSPPPMNHFSSVCQANSNSKHHPPSQQKHDLPSQEFLELQSKLLGPVPTSKENSQKNQIHSYSNSLDNSNKLRLTDKQSLCIASTQLLDSPNLVSQEKIDFSQRIHQNNNEYTGIGSSFFPLQNQKFPSLSLDKASKTTFTSNVNPQSSSSLSYSHASKHTKRGSPPILQSKQNEYYEFVNLVGSSWNLQQKPAPKKKQSIPQQLPFSTTTQCIPKNTNNDSPFLNNYVQPLPQQETSTMASQQMVKQIYKPKKDLTINTIEIQQTYSNPHESTSSIPQTISPNEQIQQLSLSNRLKPANNIVLLNKSPLSGASHTSSKSKQYDTLISSIIKEQQLQQPTPMKALPPEYQQQVFENEGIAIPLHQQPEEINLPSHFNREVVVMNKRQQAGEGKAIIKEEPFFLSPKHPKSQPGSTKSASKGIQFVIGSNRGVKENSDLHNVSSTQKSRQGYPTIAFSNVQGDQKLATVMKKKLCSREVDEQLQKLTNSNLKQSSTRDSSTQKLQKSELVRLVHQTTSMLTTFYKQREVWRQEKNYLQGELSHLKSCLQSYEENHQKP